MQVWNVLRPARWKCHSKNRQKVAIWAPSYRQSEKMVKQQCLPHMPLQYGDHRPTSGWDLLASLGHPCKFQQVSRLGSVTPLLHDTLVVGVSQTLRHWTDGATDIRQGGHHIGHWPSLFYNSRFSDITTITAFLSNGNSACVRHRRR